MKINKNTAITLNFVNFDTKSIEYIRKNQLSNYQDDFCQDVASNVILDMKNLKKLDDMVGHFHILILRLNLH